MTMPHPSAPRPRRKLAKPEEPRDDLPLYAHRNGQWTKTIDEEGLFRKVGCTNSCRESR